MTLETKQKIKSHIVSAGVTILTSFLGTVGLVIAAVPNETWKSEEVYTAAFWVALGYAVLRGLARTIPGMIFKDYYKL